MTRLTSFRFGRVQSRETTKTLARSPLPGWNSDGTVGKQKIPTSARISILESRVADSLPKRFLSGNSNPDKSKNFLGACLFKSAHSGGNQVRDPHDVGATASNCKIVKTRLIVRTVRFGPPEPFFPCNRELSVSSTAPRRGDVPRPIGHGWPWSGHDGCDSHSQRAPDPSLK